MTDKVIGKMIRHFETDVRRINHALKVYGLASFIAAKEKLPEQQKQTVEIIALLHDAGIKEAEKKYCSSAAKYQEQEGPGIARNLLAEEDIDSAVVERVCFVIGNHHTYSKIDGIDFQIIVEADFLVNIFEDEIDENIVKIIRDKYFNTKTGKELINSMYLQ